MVRSEQFESTPHRLGLDPTRDGGSPRVARNFPRVSRAFAAIAVAFAVIGCGGGSSGGGGSDSGSGPAAGGGAVASGCEASAGGGDGYALGVCTKALAAQVQAVDASVMAVPGGYTLTLGFPATLPASLSGSTSFSEAANRTEVGVRDVIGVLRGAAYEDPRGNAPPTPPYVALTSFQTITNVGSTQPTQSFIYSSFGIWEKAQTADSGYFGPWYGALNSAAVKDWPISAHTYKGSLAGVLSPLRVVPGRNSWTYGFSADITITVGADGRIIPSASTISNLIASYPGQVAAVPLTIATLTVEQAASDSRNDLLTGTLTGPDLGASAFEASYFGPVHSPGQEIVGRFRFKTLGGVLAIGSFGARQQD